MRINEIQEGADREYLSLPKEDIERLRAKFLPDWEYKDNSLQKRYKFEDYFEVIKFLINTVKPQEKLDHHADLGVFYDEVLVKIYTHRTKDVSDYDFMVAMQMDMIAKKMHGAINRLIIHVCFTPCKNNLKTQTPIWHRGNSHSHSM